MEFNELRSLHSCLVQQFCTAAGSAAALCPHRDRVYKNGRWAPKATHLMADVYLLHGGFVQLVEIQRIDAVLGPKYQILI